MAISSPFMWGSKGRKMSPEALERERAIIDGIKGRVGDTSPVGHWTQGAARVVDAITGQIRDRRAEASEQMGMDSADDYIANNPVLSALIGSGGGGITTGIPAGVATPLSEEEQLGDAAMQAIGKPPVGGAGADQIRQGLLARGLPEHVADAFIMNFQDESGLNPGINEANPLVPGSRGGFGLAQWTGPRRRQLEQFAQQRGTPVSDVDTQLDFLMHELQGPEANAAQAIFGAQDAGEAASAIVNKFLRPAESHRARREANYLGAGGSPMGGSFTGGNTQMAGNSNVVAALTGAMSDPWVAKKYGPVIQAMLGQQMRRGDMDYQARLKQQDPAYQLGLQRAQLEIDAMRNPAAPEPITVGGVLVDPTTYEPLFDSRTDKDPTSVGEYKFYADQAIAAGQEPLPYDQWDVARKQAGASSTNVTVGDGMPALGKLSTDHAYLVDPETGQPVIDPETRLPIAAPVPGTPAARGIQAEDEAKAASKRNAVDYAKTVTQDIGIADDYLSDLEGGMAGGDNVASANLRRMRSGIAGTPEYNMSQFVESALSNVTLDTMNRMRETSAAGATGMGNMSDRQVRIIQGVLGQWSPGLPIEDQRLILHRLGNFYLDVQVGTAAERAEAVRDGRMSAEENAAIQAQYYPETRDNRGNKIEDGAGDPDTDGWTEINGFKIRAKQ